MKATRVLAALAVLGLALMAGGFDLFRLDPTADAAGRLAYAQLHDGQFDALLAHSTTEMRTPGAKAKLAQVRAMLPAGPPRSTKAVGRRDMRFPGREETLALSQEYDYGDRVVLAQTALVRKDFNAPWLVNGLHAQVATNAQLATTKFTLDGSTPLRQIGFLAATILSPLLMLAALAKVVFTRDLERKWLWGILAFIGVFSFHMNWMTGSVDIQWASLQVIGVGAMKGASRFAPWILTCAFPLGALLILSGLVARAPKDEDEDADQVRTEPAGS